MRKNIIIIGLIFIVPILAYAILSDSQSVEAAKRVEGQPMVIKFSSKLCADCKKIKGNFDELKPQYEDRMSIIEYDVQNNDAQTASAIDEYNITLVPTIVFIDKNGKEVKRTEGYVNKSELQGYFDKALK